jgi:hypothetical protein
VDSVGGFKATSEEIYVASYSGSVSDGMAYKKWGNEVGLYLLYPELRKIIGSYPIRTADFRLINGDRLRIYDINKNEIRLAESRPYNYHSLLVEKNAHEKTTPIHT